MFDPKIFPSAKSTLRLIAAKIPTTNSGREVPPATMTTPIAKREIFNFFPKLTDPLMTTSAPATRIIKPKIKYKKST